jgi:hypothetical protein
MFPPSPIPRWSRSCATWWTSSENRFVGAVHPRTLGCGFDTSCGAASLLLFGSKKSRSRSSTEEPSGSPYIGISRIARG